jgi:WD40 repeat protein
VPLPRVITSLVSLALAVCTLGALPAHGQMASAQPADAPMLRVDTGSHSAAIRALATDAAGHYAVTASDDKTARVWDLSSGRLLQTLRPPVGVDNIGRLFAAAMTPDGTVVAVGGWSADNDVYLFERATGIMVQRITGLPNTITQLAFAPNGQMLVIGLWGQHGVRLFGTTAGWHSSNELDSDAKYEGEVYGAHFSPDGKRLATASVDGRVRLYDVGQRRLTLVHSVRPAGAGQPFSVAFAPDGNLLAVSFAETPAVAVLQADTLQPAYVPSVAGIDNGSLNALAWSHDGRELLAGGTWKRADGLHGLRTWADRGRGAALDASVASDSIVALRGLADGRTVYASADSAWGWQTRGAAQPDRARLQTVASGLVDFRGNRDQFRLARDGSAVAFTARRDRGAVEASGFDVKNAAWTPPVAQWLPASASGRGLQVSDWSDSVRPRFNGNALPLTDNEVSMSVAVTPDGSSFALGTSFYLRLLKANGAVLWRVAAPGATWQVNVSGDGRWVVAGFSDGTLRWYRARDGVELLALLPHADRKRWIAWTPQGYYAASPGGEDLFGWQINRGPSRAADFFPASRFRATYFRPDVIAAVLATADFDAALRQANQSSAGSANFVAAPDIEPQTPPVVTLLSPKDGESFSKREVTLSLSIRAPAGAPPISLRARLNGSVFELPLAAPGALAVGRNLVVAASGGPGRETPAVRYEQRITLPAQDAELMVFADNRNGYSTPAVLRLKWTGPPASASDAAAEAAAVARPKAQPGAKTPAGTPGDLRPALYVLAVGVSKYQNQGIQLAYAAKDATDFSNVFKLQENQLYRKVEVKLLTDAGAKRDDILDGLEWIRREMTARDVGVVFMAGHGINDSDGVYYYLPQDTDPDRLKRTGVIFTEIRNTLASLPGKALFFVDTCHSGNVLGTGRRAMGSDLTSIVNELSSAENGVVVFAASTGRQFAQESPEWGNGAFTRAVVEGMSGKADVGRTGRVTHKMLDLYVSERVKALTRGTQSPVTIVPQGISDFPVAISR